MNGSSNEARHERSPILFADVDLAVGDVALRNIGGASMIYAMLVHKRNEAIDEYAELRHQHKRSKTYFQHLMELTTQMLHTETTWIRVARKGNEWGRRRHARRGS